MAQAKAPDQIAKQIIDIAVEDEMRDSFMPLCAVGHHGTSDTRRTGRAEACPAPDPLCDERSRTTSRNTVPQVGWSRRRGDGEVSPSRRQRHL